MSTESPRSRERAVRLVREHGASTRPSVESIAGKLTAETLRKWVRQAERDRGSAVA